MQRRRYQVPRPVYCRGLPSFSAGCASPQEEHHENAPLGPPEEAPCQNKHVVRKQHKPTGQNAAHATGISMDMLTPAFLYTSSPVCSREKWREIQREGFSRSRVILASRRTTAHDGCDAHRWFSSLRYARSWLSQHIRNSAIISSKLEGSCVAYNNKVLTFSSAKQEATPDTDAATTLETPCEQGRHLPPHHHPLSRATLSLHPPKPRYSTQAEVHFGRCRL